MKLLDLTLPTPAENLALDEALLDWAEEENTTHEYLRLWESPQPIVVVGRSSRVPVEVEEAACRQSNIPILRRSSGGATIVAGPGCLMYALVLSYDERPELKDIRRAHAFVLGRIAEALQPHISHLGNVEQAGTSDLVLVERTPGAVQCKFSGNSLRAKRSHFLYHGTLLYNFDLSLIGSCLRMPPRVPDYREGRLHADFIMNLPVSRDVIRDALDSAWPTDSNVTNWPAKRVAELVDARFARDDWNFEFA